MKNFLQKSPTLLMHLTLAWVLSLNAGLLAQNLDSLPDGYQAGRADAPYGTYTSPVQDSIRPFQDRLATIEKKVFGLSVVKDMDVLELAQQAYLLEHEIIRLQKDISEISAEEITAFEKLSLLNSTVRVYRHLRSTSERQFEDMIRFIDKVFPGPNGGQFRLNDNSADIGKILYQPNYRQDTLLSPAEQKIAYEKRLAEATAEGFKPEEILTLDKAYFDSLKGFHWFEYVALPNGEIKITKGKAGHILLASGQPLRSAGQIVIHNDAQGRPLSFVITNASGSYKPDIVSTEIVAEELAEKLKIPRQLLVVTKGEPFSLQTVKIYMKGRKIDKATIDARIASLKSQAKAILEAAPSNVIFSASCAKLVSSLIH